MDELIETVTTHSEPVVMQVTMPENLGSLLAVMIISVVVLLMAQIAQVAIAFIQMRRSWLESDAIDNAVNSQRDSLINEVHTGEKKRADYLETMASANEEDEVHESVPVYQDISDEVFRNQVEKVIQDNMSNPLLSVATISGILCMDRTGLYRKVQEVYQLSPSDLIKIRRVERIKAILEMDPEMPASKLAASTGFKSKVVMDRFFMLQMGININGFREGVKRGS